MRNMPTMPLSSSVMAAMDIQHARALKEPTQQRGIDGVHFLRSLEAIRYGNIAFLITFANAIAMHCSSETMQNSTYMFCLHIIFALHRILERLDYTAKRNH